MKSKTFILILIIINIVITYESTKNSYYLFTDLFLSIIIYYSVSVISKKFAEK